MLLSASPLPLGAERPCSPLASIMRLERNDPLDRVAPLGGGTIPKPQPCRTLTRGPPAASRLLLRRRGQRRDKHRAHSCLHRADQGRLLDCLVRWGNLTEGKIRAYLGEVLEAVRYLHNCRIAHLDLKVSGLPGAEAGVSEHRASQLLHCIQARRPGGRGGQVRGCG